MAKCMASPTALDATCQVTIQQFVHGHSSNLTSQDVLPVPFLISEHTCNKTQIELSDNCDLL